jgi:hypothetical protein
LRGSLRRIGRQPSAHGALPLAVFLDPAFSAPHSPWPLSCQAFAFTLLIEF